MGQSRMSKKDIDALRKHVKQLKRDMMSQPRVERPKPKYLSLLVNQLFRYGLPPNW